MKSDHDKIPIIRNIDFESGPQRLWLSSVNRERRVPASIWLLPSASPSSHPTLISPPHLPPYVDQPLLHMQLTTTLWSGFDQWFHSGPIWSGILQASDCFGPTSVWSNPLPCDLIWSVISCSCSSLSDTVGLSKSAASKHYLVISTFDLISDSVLLL